MPVTKRSDLDRPLTWAEADSNLEQLEAKANAAAVMVSITVSLNAGETVVEHGLGRKARIVHCIDKDGIQQNIPWKRTPGNELNAITLLIDPEEDDESKIEDVEVNILCLQVES